MYTLAYLFGAFIIFLFLYRFISYKVFFANYREFCLNYCTATRKSPEFCAEISRVWPMEHVLFDLNYWGIEKYIVNQDMYQDMLLDLEKKTIEIMKRLEKELMGSLAATPEKDIKNPDNKIEENNKS